MLSLLGKLNIPQVINEDIPEELGKQWNDKNTVARNVLMEYLSNTYFHFAKDIVFTKDI